MVESTSRALIRPGSNSIRSPWGTVDTDLSVQCLPDRRPLLAGSAHERSIQPPVPGIACMCVGLVALNQSPKYPLVVALNRDEFFSRPTTAANFWEGTEILGGRDRVSGGTWFGVTRSGYMGLVTNFRAGSPDPATGKSRGSLVAGFLERPQSAMDYAAAVARDCEQYSPFNLLLWDMQRMGYVSSRMPPQPVTDSVFGLSNGDLDQSWPKVRRGTSMLQEAIAEDLDSKQLVDRLFGILADRTRPQDKDLPKTGIGMAAERELSPVFVDIPSQDYGTRTSTVLLIDREQHVVLVERTYNREAESCDDVVFDFTISPG